MKIIRVHLFFKTLVLAIFTINFTFSSPSADKLKTNTSYSHSQDSVYHTEKVYLHFDKPYYSSGEFMWFKTYLVSANTNRPDTKSQLVHVELINPSGKIVNSRSIKIEDGGGEGEFYLPKKLASGVYNVRAYTNFMRNFDSSYFFTKKVNIRNQNSLTSGQPQFIKASLENKTENTASRLKPDLQFFPEGGHMVIDKTSTIGFKAIDSNGKSMTVSGSILDSNDKEILAFQTEKFGLGKFKLTPKKEETYRAVISHKQNTYTYKLPKILQTGVTMQVIERKDKYQVHLRSSLPKGVNNLTLIALQNGNFVSLAQLKGSKEKGVVNIPKKDLKLGIAQFTILDEDQKPLCERLVFVETDQSLSSVSMMPNKTEYGKRDFVELAIELDSLVQANMSLAVTDVSVVNAEQNSLDIRSYLLLNSELKGEIEQPGYYFNAKNSDRKRMLDLLMMTQGWRQFLWNHAEANKNQESKNAYTHETGIRIKGIVKNKTNPEKTASAEVTLTYMNKEELVEEMVRSSKNGLFQFGDYQFRDSTSVIIQAKNYKIKKRRKKDDSKKLIMDYEIVLDTFKPHPIMNNPLNRNDSLEIGNDPMNRNYLIRSAKVRLNSVRPFEDDAEKLEEVVVKHTRIKKEVKEKFKNRQTIYGEPSYRVDFDEIQTTASTNNVIAAMRGKVPGLRMSGNIDNPVSKVMWVDGESSSQGGGQGKVQHKSPAKPVISRNYGLSIRGGLVPPLILLNNFEIQDFSAILAEEVSHVDILSPTRSAMYGSRGMGGVISIHTKRGNEGASTVKKDRNGIISFIHPGFYKARKFYEPSYSVKRPEHKNFDYRTTIHWEPTLQLSENKKAKVSFYTADISTTYRIDLQGITKDGVPIVDEIYIDVD